MDPRAKFATRIAASMVLTVPALCSPALASDGYTITGKQGVMFFVAVDPSEKDNEDVYRFAVGEACGLMAVCQVQFWIGTAPDRFPLTEDQVDAKLVQWQVNLNTGLRRWLVKCRRTDLFASERECM